MFNNPVAFIEPSTDLLLVNRGGTSFKCLVQDLPTNAQDDDLLLANRDGKSYKVRYADLGNARDTDQILVNRNGASFHSSVGELKGNLAVDVTFDILLQTPAETQTITGDRRKLCGGETQTVSVQGGRLTATIQAKSSDTYSISDDTFSINGEWMVICGRFGDFGYDYQGIDFGDGFVQCTEYKANNDQQKPKGLSDIGINFVGVGNDPLVIQKNEPTRQSLEMNGRGGYGCPPGVTDNTQLPTYGSGGGSQTRPRAENSPDNTYNGVMVRNPGFGNHNDSNGTCVITANGVQYTGGRSGTLGELF